MTEAQPQPRLTVTMPTVDAQLNRWRRAAAGNREPDFRQPRASGRRDSYGNGCPL